jgi:hypothetical protein
MTLRRRRQKATSTPAAWKAAFLTPRFDPAQRRAHFSARVFQERRHPAGRF